MPPGTTSATIPRIYGIDTDAAGNFWLTDTFNNRILKYSADRHLPRRRTAPGGSTATPGAWRSTTPATGSTSPTRASGRSEVFDLQGQFLENLGGGAGAGPPTSARRGSPRSAPTARCTSRSTATPACTGSPPTATTPASSRDPAQPADRGPARRAARRRRRRPDRRRLGGGLLEPAVPAVRGRPASSSAPGAPAAPSPEYGMNYPRGIGDRPGQPSGLGGQPARPPHQALRVRRHLRRPRSATPRPTREAVGSFRWPLDIEFYGGKAVVTDRNSTKVKILDAATGAETELVHPVRQPRHARSTRRPATSIVADGTKIYQYNPTGTSLITQLRQRPGTGDGQFRHIWDMVVSNGVLYVTDDTASRIQAFTTSGTFLGKWGGFGSGAYQFKNPSGHRRRRRRPALRRRRRQRPGHGLRPVARPAAAAPGRRRS